MLKNYTIEEVVKSDYARHPTLYYKCKEQTGDLPKWGIFSTTVLGGIQVVSCAATPLTLRVASGYRGGVFFELTRD